MIFLIIHNEYRDRGGEETVVEFQKQLLESYGHKVLLYKRNYHEYGDSLFGKIKSVFTSVYNSRSVKDITSIVNKEKPQVAIIHNVFSIISPAVIPALKKQGVEVWQVVHNYRMFCPIGIFYNTRKGKICEECLGRNREWNCLKNHCTENIFNDFAFSLKFSLVRKKNYYDSVDKFLCLNKRQMDKLKSYGINEKKLYFLPNAIKEENEEAPIQYEKKKYIGFAGRLTKEKGFYDFIELAKLMPKYTFRVAGKVPEDLEKEKLPANIVFLGFLDKKAMIDFYKTNKVLLFLSHWYETFGLTALESMIQHTPVITYSVSAASEIIEDKKDGFVLQKTGDILSLQQKVKELFDNQELYSYMCKNAYEKASKEYTPKKYYERLMNINTNLKDK
ncbi:MAG: glycosyltransferase family 4 protein [Bacteroidales bacterium]|nr:glycosyltransferase family 4 protein [Bacteroidales bacterium]